MLISATTALATTVPQQPLPFGVSHHSQKELRPVSVHSRRQHVPLERISFIDALRWLRDAGPDTRLTPLVVNPERPDRLEPRVLKRRMKEYTLMKKPRNVLRKALRRKKRAA